jgi:tetratricopeptide (TPR) repeat protein
MSELRLEPYSISSAQLGPQNPLPALQKVRGINFVDDAPNDIPPEDRAHLGYGFDLSLLPYQMQDGYNRNKREKLWQAAVLENEILRATFLPELGGRLWSLFHKPSGRELLYRNPVFQPANLAVRNAWFSGGVEWNIAVPGHSPLTCSPLFAGQVTGPEDEPILRLYEWERARQVPFQIDAYLPSGSPMLFIHVSIYNPHAETIPMYWWSNIAVPERPEVRVLTPSDFAYKYSYRGGLQRVPVPAWQETDFTYSTNLKTANDFFFRILDEQRPWICALDEQGKGLIQTSTSRLQGRKLFAWGMHPGGRRWQEYLSEADQPYIEIQAGLARTQSQCLPMPPQTEWSWTEAYGFLEADATLVHGDNWDEAWRNADQEIERLLPATSLETVAQQLTVYAAQSPEDLMHMGSGWGALERLRREQANEQPMHLSGQLFPDASLGEEQAPWLELLKTGRFPFQSPSQEPGAYMVQAEWRELLENAVQQQHSNHWLSWLHLGIMRYHAGQRDEAYVVWNKSLEQEPSAWALRNLGMLDKEDQQFHRAAELYLRAVEIAPSVTRLVIECLETLLLAERASDIPPLVDMLPAEVRSHSRVQLLLARAALQLNDLETVAAILNQPMEFADIREGEVSLTNIWFEMHEKRLAHNEGLPIDETLKKRVRAEFPSPPQLDFRTSGG